MHVLCASSDYEQLSSLCDRVIVFGRGRVWRELVGAEVTKDRIIEQCYARDGGRGRGGRRVSEATAGPARQRERSAPSALADFAERYALLAVWGVTCVVFGILRPGHVPDDVELHDDLRLAGDPRRAHAGAARPADGRRLRPLGRRDDGAREHDARDPQREPRLVDRRGDRRRARRRARSSASINGALVVLLEIDSLIVTLGTSTFIAGVDPLDQQLADDQRHLRQPDQPRRRRAVPRDPARVLLRHRARARDVLRLRVHAASGGGCCSSAAAAASRG